MKSILETRDLFTSDYLLIARKSGACIFAYGPDLLYEKQSKLPIQISQLEELLGIEDTPNFPQFVETDILPLNFGKRKLTGDVSRHRLLIFTFVRRVKKRERELIVKENL